MNQWTPESVTALLTTIASLVISVIAAWKAVAAHGAAQNAQATSDANTVHGATLSDRVHNLAVMTPPPVAAPITLPGRFGTVTGQPAASESAPNVASHYPPIQGTNAAST